MKFFCRFPECATKVREDSTYSQLVFLSRKPEFHLLGNHLLEDAYSMFFCAAYFEDDVLLSKSRKLLFGELSEQVLPDGAHYEQSAMYHCILLDRLLDCYNMALSRGLAADADVLRGYAVRMLGHLESIVYGNGDIPLMNDAARGIAPEASAIFDYGKRLGLEWDAIPLNECGYRKLSDGDFEVLIDVGEIAAAYQPGHSHADVLNYELRIGGVPVVVDTGISTYDKCPRRQYERSGTAHNVVTVGDRSSAEVWGGFRVGYRYSCKPVGENSWEVRGYGDGTVVRRTFGLADGVFSVEDSTDSDEECVSFIHVKSQGSRVESRGSRVKGQETVFCQESRVKGRGSRVKGQESRVESQENSEFSELSAGSADAEDGRPETVVVLDSGHRVEIWGATKVEIKGERISREYNIFEDISVIELHFRKGVRYKIL
ncbi:MAG: heparinase II/III family protein [Muribaculaceae bacterium]